MSLASSGQHFTKPVWHLKRDTIHLLSVAQNTSSLQQQSIKIYNILLFSWPASKISPRAQFWCL